MEVLKVKKTICKLSLKTFKDHISRCWEYRNGSWYLRYTDINNKKIISPNGQEACVKMDGRIFIAVDKNNRRYKPEYCFVNYESFKQYLKELTRFQSPY